MRGWRPPAPGRLFMKAYSYKSVESILKNNLDGKELPGEHYRELYRPREHPGQNLL